MTLLLRLFNRSTWNIKLLLMLRSINKGAFMRRNNDVPETQIVAIPVGGVCVKEVRSSFMTGKEPPSQNYDLAHCASRGELDKRVNTKVLSGDESARELAESLSTESSIFE